MFFWDLLPFANNISLPTSIDHNYKQSYKSSYHMLEFYNFLNGKFSILHLNINSFFMKADEIQMILDKKLFDIIMLNESKLDETIPTKFTDHINYISLRRDRTRNGGGILIFIRREYKVYNINIHSKIECIYFSIKYCKTILNFISCYKPPNENNQIFLDTIEEIFYTYDLLNPIFIRVYPCITYKLLSYHS